MPTYINFSGEEVTFKPKGEEQIYTDLFNAVEVGNLKEFQRLLSLQKDDFDINWADKDNYTFLMGGSQNGQMNIVEYLLEKGATVDQKDKDGYTALYSALVDNRLDIVRLLLESGADPNVQPYSINHVFPLYGAAQGNLPEMCELLLSFGANLDQKMAHGHTSLDVAIDLNHTETIRVLQTATDKKEEEKSLALFNEISTALKQKVKEVKTLEEQIARSDPVSLEKQSEIQNKLSVAKVDMNNLTDRRKLSWKSYQSLKKKVSGSANATAISGNNNDSNNSNNTSNSKTSTVLFSTIVTTRGIIDLP